MHKKVLVVTLISTLLIMASFPMVAFGAYQPPVNADSMFIGTIGQPNRLDPADSYDTASGEVISTVYETLIDFKRDPTKDPDDPLGSNIAEFVPKLATALPTVVDVSLDIVNMTVVNQSDPICTLWENATGHWFHINNWKDNKPDGTLGPVDVIYVEEVDPISHEWIPCTKFAWQIWIKEHIGNVVHIIANRTIYYFEIRPGVKFQDWQDYFGVWHKNETMTTEDVEYSFERALIQDRMYGPMWMWYKPLFDDMNADFWWGSTADKIELGRLIDCAIQHNNTHVWISVGINFPEIAWLQILSQSWSSIVPKAFAIDHRCWNGTWALNGTGYPLYAGWRRWPTISRSPLSRAPTTWSPWNSTPWEHLYDPAPTCRGTGPYTFGYWHTADKEVYMYWYPYYWQGWTNFDGQHPYHIKYIFITGVPDWPTRSMMFTEGGEFDFCAVPRANMRELLIPPTYEDPLPGIVCYKDLPTILSDSLFFQFVVTEGSPYMPTIRNLNQSLFFSDINARKAFAYCLNFTRLIPEAWWDEAVQSATWCVNNLIPDYQDPTVTPYNINTTKVKEYLQAAIYNMTGTPESLWDSGFTMDIIYNEGNDQRRIVCEMIRDVLHGFNAERAGPDIVITISAIDWDSYLDAAYGGQMPCWEVGWLADFMDPDNWARPYMHEYGDYAYMQYYANHTASLIIDEAVKTPNSPEREEMYHELQHTFINDCPTLMIVQPYGRVWMRNWVQGWYLNMLYPSAYMPYYDRWKGFLEDFNRDLKVNLSDLVKLATKFGAKIGDPTSPPDPPYDPIYDLNGDGNINLSDLVRCAKMFGAGVP